MAAPVVLLTDFGWTAYVGVMKGVISKLCPEARIIDLTHLIGSQNVREAAWVLLNSYGFFPKGSVFVAVVDPGVGSARRALAVEAGGFFFLGPDNGVLYSAVTQAGAVQAVVLDTTGAASTTFHGRDVFAPAAARLAMGTSLSDLGEQASGMARLSFHLQGREGEVVSIDHFGNVVSNLPPVPGKGTYRVSLKRDGQVYFRDELLLFPAYALASPGLPFLITGSSSTLEISVRNGSAAGLLGSMPGDYLAAG